MNNWKDVSDLDFRVVLLFEEIQLHWLLEFKNKQQLGLLLNAYPDVSWYIQHKAPDIARRVTQIANQYNQTLSLEDIKQMEREFVASMMDWVIYVTDPDAYDRLSFNKWDTNELLDITPFENKLVIDVGSGTGSQAFRVAPLAQTVFCVEPVANLRTYLRKKAEHKGVTNIHVVDGLIEAIPFPDNFADIVMGGHVFGDHPDTEFKEMLRVVKPGGTLIFMPGNNDVDNDVHRFLMNKGMNWDRFLEPGPDYGHGWKRKYWLTKV